MDADRFDALVRSLDRSSRRRLLGLLASVAGSALALLLGLDGAAAQKRTKRKKRRKKRLCPPGKVVCPGTSPVRCCPATHPTCCRPDAAGGHFCCLRSWRCCPPQSAARGLPCCPPGARCCPPSLNGTVACCPDNLNCCPGRPDTNSSGFCCTTCCTTTGDCGADQFCNQDGCCEESCEPIRECHDTCCDAGTICVMPWEGAVQDRHCCAEGQACQGSRTGCCGPGLTCVERVNPELGTPTHVCVT